MEQLPRLVLVVSVLPLFHSIGWASPHLELSARPQWPVAETPSAPTTTVAVASPGLTASTWGDKISSSTIAHLMPRQDSSTADASSASSPAPATTSRPSLAQLVVDSTTLSTLPPAICGFVPVWNESTTALFIVGCVSSSSVGTSFLSNAVSFPYDGEQICTSTDGALFCSKSACSTCTTNSLWTGCVDISVSYSTYYDYSYYSYLTDGFTYMYTYNYSASTYVTTWTGNDTTSVRTETYIYTITESDSLTSPISSVLLCQPSAGYYDYYWDESFVYTGGMCQTLAMGESTIGYQCRPASRSASSSTLLTEPTLNIVGLDEVRSAFPSLTVSFGTQVSGSLTYLWQESAYPTLTFPGAATRTPNPLDHLEEIASGPPACVNNQNVTCPSLSYSAESCWSQAFPPGPQGCYCSALEQTNCTAVCQDTPNDRNNYFEWAMRLCTKRNITTGENNSTIANFTTLWPEYANRSAGIYEDLFPWDWRLRSWNGTVGQSNSTANDTLAPTNSTCASSAGSKLSSFAITNGVVAVAVPLAHRGLFNRLTGARFGVAGSRNWPFMGLLAVGLNLSATAINAATALRASGYGKGENMLAPSLSTLFFFWTARPRTWWVATLLVRADQSRMSYLAVAASAMLAEIIQQFISVAIFFMVVATAGKRGYYGVDALEYAPSGKKALVMYIAAVFSLVGFAGFIIFIILLISSSSRRLHFLKKEKSVNRAVPMQDQGNGDTGLPDKKGKSANEAVPMQDLGNGDGGLPDENPFALPLGAYQATVEVHPLPTYNNAVRSMGLNMGMIFMIKSFYFWMLVPFLAQWFFWVGWVLMAGDGYCPPKNGSMTACWIMFELIGGLLGAL